jgi:hypothetical protein
MEATGSILIEPKCSSCGARTATIEISPPNVYPRKFANFVSLEKEIYLKHRNFAAAYMTYFGPGNYSGIVGTQMTAERVQQMIDAFTEPVTASKIKGFFYDDAGFCLECEAFYCERCWAPSHTGYGHCPRGHGKSLDPFWNWRDD